MAIDYTTLFGDVGKLVKYINSFEVIADTTLPAASTAVATQLEERVTLLANFDNDFSTMEANVDNWRAKLADYVRLRLQDKTTVVDELGLTTNSIDSVLSALIVQMQTDSESVDKSTATIGSASAGSDNVGSVTVVATALLDGVTAPGKGFRPQTAYAGLTSELVAPSETLRLTCVRDSYTDGVTEGSEAYSLVGGYNLGSRLSHFAEGSGTGPTLTTLNGTTLVSNGDFETFTTANVADDWTTVSGTAGTHVFSSTSSPYRGSKSLKLHGDGTQGTIQRTQVISGLVPLTGYLLTAAIKADATIAQGDLSIKFIGTGYTAGSTAKISIAPGDLPTSWTVYSAYVLVPANPPSDFRLAITWETTPTNNKNVYIDSVCLALPVYFAGIGLGVAAGPSATPAVRGDTYTVDISNNEAGIFQSAFRRMFGVQLPSDASPTISDSLAS